MTAARFTNNAFNGNGRLRSQKETESVFLNPDTFHLFRQDHPLNKTGRFRAAQPSLYAES
jgi:hypothetical protein